MDHGDAQAFDPRAALRALQELRAEQDLADNWRDHYERLDAPRRAWADLLMRQPWHWFATLTFKPQHEGRGGGIHPEKGEKAFRLLASSINRDIYGPRWHKRKLADNQLHGGVVWAVGQEFHKSGRIHYHALLACQERDLSDVARRLSWMDWWFERFGIARIEPPKAQEDVAGYVSKYVVKDGEISLSPNFGKVRPPSLFGSPGQETGPG